MSRISRYQDSMSKYMKNKSCLVNLEEPVKTDIYNIIEDCDYLIPVVLLTVLCSQNRKNKTSSHGYYMGCGIELLMILSKIMDNSDKYNNEYKEKNIRRVINKITTLINICLSQNIEYIQTNVSKEKVLKIFHNCLKCINDKLYNILDDTELEVDLNIKYTDLVKYEFKNLTEAKNKIMSLKQVKRNQLVNFIENKYGSVCKTAMIIGWQLGSGDENMIENLDRLGSYLGNIIKLSYDFKNLESDLDNAKISTNNFIINFGIQEGFELFMDSKSKFIEGCMKMDLYTNTMKEILDLIELNVDEVINKTKIDLKSNYTLSSPSDNSVIN